MRPTMAQPGPSSDCHSMTERCPVPSIRKQPPRVHPVCPLSEQDAAGAVWCTVADWHELYLAEAGGRCWVYGCVKTGVEAGREECAAFMDLEGKRQAGTAALFGL